MRKKCLRCGIEFDLTPWSKYCSDECQRSFYVESGKAKAAKDRYRYGIEPEDYEEMKKKQNGKCAICGSDSPGRPGRSQNDRMFVDHNHVTNKFRGLLCHPCNVTIGLMKEDPARLRKAAQYLEDNELPTYVYECPSCEMQVEVVRKITEEEIKPRCKECCEGDDPDNDDGREMQRVITASTFILKGGCWAKDGYKK